MSNRLLVEKTMLGSKYAVLSQGSIKEIKVLLGEKPRIGEIYLAKVEQSNKLIGHVFLDAGTYKFFLQTKEELEQGQEILVQVIREPEESKLAKVSLDITIPGEYAVLIWSENTIKASKKTRNQKETDLLIKELSKDFQEEYGILLRTKASLENLSSIKAEIYDNENHLRNLSRPGLGIKFNPYNEIDYIESLVKKHQINELISNDKELILGIKKRENLDLKYDPIFLFNRNKIIFSNYLKPKMVYDNFSLTIQFLEALSIIDVDSGHLGKNIIKNRAFKDINEKAFLKTLDLISLLNLSGIILLDLISMDKKTRDLYDQFIISCIKKLKKGPKIIAYPITEAGLLQLVVEGTEANLLTEISSKCKNCHGSGLVLNKNMILDQFEIDLKSKIENSNQDSFKIDIPENLDPIVKEGLTEIIQAYKIECIFLEKNVNKIYIQ